jgi:hypothetical protein
MELIDIVNRLFRFRKRWDEVKQVDKDKYFFIINRLLSKQYPEISQKMNFKDIDKATCLDIWYNLLDGKNIPKDFWGKKKGESKLSNSDRTFLKRKYNLRDEEIDYLIDKYPKDVKNELKLK